MEQLILHGIGDYFIQTDEWAAGKKNKGLYGLKCCLLHCITYSIPFLLIGSPIAVLVIFITHFAFDRTNWIAYALAWKNGAYKGNDKTLGYDISNFGFWQTKPKYMSIWLFIITDNICHIICNYLALKYL